MNIIIIRRGMGRKIFRDSGETTTTRVTTKKKNVLGLQNFLRDKLPIWENNGSCVEDMEKFQGHSF